MNTKNDCNELVSLLQGLPTELQYRIVSVHPRIREIGSCVRHLCRALTNDLAHYITFHPNQRTFYQRGKDTKFRISAIYRLVRCVRGASYSPMKHLNVSLCQFQNLVHFSIRMNKELKEKKMGYRSFSKKLLFLESYMKEMLTYLDLLAGMKEYCPGPAGKRAMVCDCCKGAVYKKRKV